MDFSPSTGEHEALEEPGKADRGVIARSLSEQGELNKAELIGIPDRKLLHLIPRL
jgi:hypothetical protein